jgi:hypothetical protein
MLSIADLSQAIAAYNDGNVSLDQFADWFHQASRAKFGYSAPVRSLCLEIDLAFSRLDYDGINEDEFRRELANTILPFAEHTSLEKLPAIYFRSSDAMPPQSATSASQVRSVPPCRDAAWLIPETSGSVGLRLSWERASA